MSKYREIILSVLQEDAKADIKLIDTAKQVYKQCIEAVKKDKTVIPYLQKYGEWESDDIPLKDFEFPLTFRLELQDDIDYHGIYDDFMNKITLNISGCLHSMPEFSNKHITKDMITLDLLLKLLNLHFFRHAFIHEYQHLAYEQKGIPHQSYKYAANDDSIVYNNKYRTQPDENNSFMIQDLDRYSNRFEHYINPDMSKEEKLKALNRFINNLKTSIDKTIYSRGGAHKPQYLWANNQHKINRYFNRLYQYLYTKFINHE